MSGHSKWSTIKHKKAAQDARRGGVFTKLAGAIAVAVKRGGGNGDPETNFALRLAVERAKSANMPKDNIERAIKRGMGHAGEGTFEEIVLEAYGPQGVAMIIEATTDNRNRTVAEIKNSLEKAGGRLGEPGSVMYLFDIVGQIEGEGKTPEELELALIDMGMLDIMKENNTTVVLTEPTKLGEITSYLQEKGLKVMESVLRYRPKEQLTITPGRELAGLLENINEHDDVQGVYTNVV